MCGSPPLKARHDEPSLRRRDKNYRTGCPVGLTSPEAGTWLLAPLALS